MSVIDKSKVTQINHVDSLMSLQQIQFFLLLIEPFYNSIV